MYDLDVQLLEQLPPWYQNILDYQKLCSTEQEQFEALAAAITQVADQFLFSDNGRRLRYPSGSRFSKSFPMPSWSLCPFAAQGS